MNLIDLVRYIIKQNVPIQTEIGTVIDINEETLTCSIAIENAPERVDVLLRSTTGDNDGFIIIPELNSHVLVSIIQNNPVYSFISGYSKVAKVLIKTTDNISFEIADNQIKLNGEQYGGLVKINQLVSRLNNIETAFNELLNHYKNHNHVHPQGPTTGLLIPSLQSPLSITTVEELENKTIKHG